MTNELLCVLDILNSAPELSAPQTKKVKQKKAK